MKNRGHFDSSSEHHCRMPDCGVKLTNENWYKGDRKDVSEICKSCRREELNRRKKMFIYDAF